MVVFSRVLYNFHSHFLDLTGNIRNQQIVLSNTNSPTLCKTELSNGASYNSGSHSVCGHSVLHWWPPAPVHLLDQEKKWWSGCGGAGLWQNWAGKGKGKGWGKKIVGGNGTASSGICWILSSSFGSSLSLSSLWT